MDMTFEIWSSKFQKLLSQLKKKGMVYGLLSIKITKICEDCFINKMHRSYIHFDVCGHFEKSSLSAGHYFASFVDKFSRMIWSGIRSIFRKFKLLCSELI
jgi:hypothetical protein